MEVWLWQQRIIDNTLVWLSPIEKFWKWSWQFYYTAVTNHWQFSCMAVSLKNSLTNILYSFKDHWQRSCTALTPLTNWLCGCHQPLTNRWCSHEPHNWQNAYKIVDKVTVTHIEPPVIASNSLRLKKLENFRSVWIVFRL